MSTTFLQVDHEDDFLDMAKQEERFRGLENQTQNIRERLASIEGRLNASGAPLAPSERVHPLITVVVSAVCVGFIAYLSWAGVEIYHHNARLSTLDSKTDQIVRSTNQSNETIKEVQKDVFSLRAQISSNQPHHSENQSAAKALLAEAKEKSVAIPAPVVEQAGKSFIDAARTEPPAWNVAMDFLNYRSFLNGLNPPQTGNIEGTKQITEEGKIYAFRSAGCPVPYLEAARFTHLSHPTDETVMKKSPSVTDWIGCRWFILGDTNEIPNVTQDVNLDDHIVKNIVFIHVHIHYHGGPMVLEDVYFLDCYFDIDRNPPGIKLSEQLVAASSVSLKEPIAKLGHQQPPESLADLMSPAGLILPRNRENGSISPATPIPK